MKEYVTDKYGVVFRSGLTPFKKQRNMLERLGLLNEGSLEVPDVIDENSREVQQSEDSKPSRNWKDVFQKKSNLAQSGFAVSHVQNSPHQSMSLSSHVQPPKESAMSMSG